MTFGFVQHKSSYWNLAVVWFWTSLSGWLADDWIRREWPVLTRSRQAILTMKAFGVLAPLYLILSIGVPAIFPAWLPDACPFPRR